MKSDSLRLLYRTRPAVRALFGWLSTDGADGRCLTVEELLENAQLNRREAVSVLRELDAHGCGRFKVGRKGHVSRFEWYVDPQALAERLLGSLDEPGEDEPIDEGDVSSTSEPDHHELALDESSEPDERAHRDGLESGEDLIAHAYVLRPDTRIELRLPVDLTRREAEILAAWVHNLSFER